MKKFSEWLTYGFAIILLSALCGTNAQAAFTGSLLPIGSGLYTEWMPSDISQANYKLVKESNCDGNATYVSVTKYGKKDSYQVSLSGIPAGSLITNITVTPCASMDSTNDYGGAGLVFVSSTMDVFYVLDGVELAQSWTGGSFGDGRYYFTEFVGSSVSPVSLNPAVSNSNITVTQNTNLQVGVRSTHRNRNGVRLSNIRVQLTYVSTPTNLLASNNVQPDIVSLTWTDTSNSEDGFKIERSIDNITFSQIGTVGQNVTSYTDFGSGAGLAAGTYYYRVRTYNNPFNSGYSNVASITVPVVAH